MEPATAQFAFTPSGVEWSPVSPRLRRMRRALLVGLLGLFGLVAGVLWGLLVGPVAAGCVLAVLAALTWWGWWLIGRNHASWGYAERGEDLLIRRGFLFQELVVVPYGRMQFVDVRAGPLERYFQIATVQLHTASPGTDARIVGMGPAEAALLRDRLTELGEARLAGL